MAQIADPDSALSRLHSRLVRCRKLADLARNDGAGTRFAALADEIERHLVRHAEISAVFAQWERYSTEMIAEIDNVIDRARGALLSARISMQEDPFGPDDLREEAWICRQEALASKVKEEQRGFAGRALGLPFVAEAIGRSGHGDLK